MNPRLLAAARRVVSVFLLGLALAACGPGLTGTGTGSAPEPSAVGLTAFNATEQAVCGAPFAATLGCTPTTTAPPTPLNQPSHFEGGSGASLVRARFDGNVLVLTRPCSGFVFEGSWGRSAALGDRFYGAQELDGGRTLRAANATVTPVGSDLQITVQDAQAQVLLGPVVLQRQAAAPGAEPVACN